MVNPVTASERPVVTAGGELGALRAEIRRLWPEAPSLDFSVAGNGEQLGRLTVLKALLEQGVGFIGNPEYSNGAIMSRRKWTNENVARVLDAVGRVQRAFGISALPTPEGLSFRNGSSGAAIRFTDDPPTVQVEFETRQSAGTNFTECIIHELGHFVSHSLRNKSLDQLASSQTSWLNARNKGNSANLYADGDPEEDWAETFRWLVNQRTGAGETLFQNLPDEEPSPSRVRTIEADVKRWLEMTR